MRRIAATWAILLGCGFALVRCDHEQVAGSSVTTGNPTEIQVSFTGGNGPETLTGRIDVYGATQIPITGFRPEPLASYEVARKQDFRLASEDFASISDSLWPAGSLEGDSLARFNLVITAEGRGAILKDFAFRTKEREFSLEEVTWEQGANRVGLIEAEIATLTSFDAFVKPSTLDPDRLTYLFLPGTGFKALADSGRFTFQALPVGEHSLSFITLPGKGGILIPEDSAIVYGTDRPVVAGKTDTLSISGIIIQVPMPDAYKPNP